MPKQPAIPGLCDALKKKVTRREMFLAEMDEVVPWGRFLALIEPHYPKVGPKGGRPPMPLERMLRIYFLQSWYALSDPPLVHVNMHCRAVDGRREPLRQ